jgi:hypothetical protein
MNMRNELLSDEKPQKAKKKNAKYKKLKTQDKLNAELKVENV